MAQIYEQLHQARKQHGLTQAELGKMLGLPQGYISQVEGGRHDIRTSTLADWARVLGLELMLIPVPQVRAVSYLTQAALTTGQQQPPPAYGALPEEVV